MSSSDGCSGKNQSGHSCGCGSGSSGNEADEEGVECEHGCESSNDDGGGGIGGICKSGDCDGQANEDVCEAEAPAVSENEPAPPVAKANCFEPGTIRSEGGWQWQVVVQPATRERGKLRGAATHKWELLRAVSEVPQPKQRKGRSSVAERQLAAALAASLADR